MLHRIVIERLFTLGDYKNIKIIAEASEVPDEIWNDSEQLALVREGLEKEIFVSYAQHLTMLEENITDIRSGEYANIYVRYK